MPDTRLCLICRRSQDDPLHGAIGPPTGAHDVTPRIEQHAFDPGERRQAIRRMDDRVAEIERALGTRPVEERRVARERRGG